jgi:hypothetical protein
LSKAVLDSAKTVDPMTPNKAAVAKALEDPVIKTFTVKLAGGIKLAGCAVDHIVEKHMGGASVPSNLQLFDAKRNSDSGTKSFTKVKELVAELRAPGMRGAKAKQIQIFYDLVTVPVGGPDPSFVIETLLVAGHVKGDDKLKAKGEGKPVTLKSGPNSASAPLKDTGVTEEIPLGAERVVQGLKLVRYKRSSAGPKGKTDDAEGDLDHKALAKLSAKQNRVKIKASLETTAPAAGTPVDPATTDAAAAASGEIRRFSILPGPQKIPFEYPSLSPGYLATVGIDDNGQLTGTGVIEPTVKFLPKLKIDYGPKTLKVTSDINHDTINQSAAMKPLISQFRFTKGELKLDLMDFKPEGQLDFTLGPAKKPVMSGWVKAYLEAGSFALKGQIKPEITIPGTTAAEGEVSYVWGRGWAASAKATGTPFAGATANIELGFTQGEGQPKFYGNGGISTKVKGADLLLEAKWHGHGVAYSGSVTVTKPLPLIDQVKLWGSYSNDLLYLEGKADAKWKGFTGSMTVTYRQKSGEEGVFGGTADLKIKTDKLEGNIILKSGPEGFTGKGSVGYQITKDIRPTLGIEIDSKHRIKVSGEVTVKDIILMKEWPKPGGGYIPLVKGGVQIPFPTPIPTVTGFFEIYGSLGFAYGVGPAAIKSITFKGEAYPLEDDPKISASIGATFHLPGFVALKGTLGANIGAQVLGGVVGAKGGVSVDAVLRAGASVTAPVSATYKEGNFGFSAKAGGQADLSLTAAVNLNAEIYALRGLFSHKWTWELGKFGPANLGSISVTFGEFSSNPEGGLNKPEEKSDSPKELDPIEMMKGALSSAKDKGKNEETEDYISYMKKYGRPALGIIAPGAGLAVDLIGLL